MAIVITRFLAWIDLLQITVCSCFDFGCRRVNININLMLEVPGNIQLFGRAFLVRSCFWGDAKLISIG